MDEIVITSCELDRLLEYSTSLPTGTTIGKRWKRLTAGGEWVIGEYVEHPNPETVGIRWAWAVREPGCVHRHERGRELEE